MADTNLQNTNPHQVLGADETGAEALLPDLETCLFVQISPIHLSTLPRQLHPSLQSLQPASEPSKAGTLFVALTLPVVLQNDGCDRNAGSRQIGLINSACPVLMRSVS